MQVLDLVVNPNAHLSYEHTVNESVDGIVTEPPLHDSSVEQVLSTEVSRDANSGFFVIDISMAKEFSKPPRNQQPRQCNSRQSC